MKYFIITLALLLAACQTVPVKAPVIVEPVIEAPVVEEPVIEIPIVEPSVVVEPEVVKPKLYIPEAESMEIEGEAEGVAPKGFTSFCIRRPEECK